MLIGSVKKNTCSAAAPWMVEDVWQRHPPPLPSRVVTGMMSNDWAPRRRWRLTHTLALWLANRYSNNSASSLLLFFHHSRARPLFLWWCHLLGITRPITYPWRLNFFGDYSLLIIVIVYFTPCSERKVDFFRIFEHRVRFFEKKISGN